MAIILYPSGITEMYEPKEHIFTDQKILHIFSDFDFIRTARLYEIPNTWCVWGENKKIDDGNFNKLASDILRENIFCHVLFIHDTEIDPAWMLTDQTILIGYDIFKQELLKFFDFVAETVIKETQKLRENQNINSNSNLLFLNTIGPTEDKRVLFEFDPNKQSKEFYIDNFFINFANKVHDFLKTNKVKDIFYIYEDKKTVIFVKNENVDFLMEKIIGIYKKNENYEFCQDLITIQDNWKKPKIKRKRKENKNE